jgi:ribosomal protein S18 acetylase RimI-like enzyme
MGGANHLAQFIFIAVLGMSDRQERRLRLPAEAAQRETGTIMSENFFIRDYRTEDFDAVTILWRVSREKSLPEFQRAKGHFFYEDQDYFRGHILRENKIFVVECEARPVAFMAIRDDFIDQLYVHPDHQNRGIGKALLDHARQLSPEHIWLYTLQINMNARAFYERHGFTAERFGFSPPPENEPDVEYHWRKS